MTEVETTDDIHHTKPVVAKIIESIRRHIDETSIQPPADETLDAAGTAANTSAAAIDKMAVEGDDDKHDALFTPVTRKGKDDGHSEIKRHLDDDGTSTERACVIKTPPAVDVQRDNKAAEEERRRQRTAEIAEIADKRSRTVYMKGVE